MAFEVACFFPLPVFFTSRCQFDLLFADHMFQNILETRKDHGSI